MKAIVHIGAEQTNTSSIQQYLYLNRNKLRDAGYHFVQSAGESNNRALPAYCVSEEMVDDYFRAEGITTLEEREQFKQRFINEFESELRSLPNSVHTVLISSEHFHSRLQTEADVENARQLLSGYFEDIKIVCYLREQVTTCARSYSTVLKSGGTLSFEKFLAKCKPTNTYYNYLDMLAIWEKCFGINSLDVSLFEKDRFLNGSLLDDFTAKIDPSLVGMLDKNVLLENESLRPAGQVLARVVNLVFPLRSKLPDVVELRDKCQKLIAHRMPGRGQQPDLDTWQSIYNSFIDSNEQLRQKFFPSVENLFAEPFEMEAARNVVDDEFTEVLFDIVDLIKKSRIDLQMLSVYSRLWSVISTCVSDLVNVQGAGLNTGPVPGVLSDRDGHMLKNIAVNLEKSKPEAALKLMILANKVKPNSPAIQQKMEEYSKKSRSKEKARLQSKFLITYYGGDNTMNEMEYQRHHDRLGRWLELLDIPSGSSMVPIEDTNILKTSSTVLNDSASAITGYTIFQAGSLEEAITIAKQCPHLEVGGTLEVSEVSTL